MAKVYYIHWNKDGALEYVRDLRGAGHTVSYHCDVESRAKVKSMPDVVVISLARLPSHGRAVAEWWQESKQRRAIPLIFVDGAPDKVAATKAKFPGANYCTHAQLGYVIGRLVE